MWAASFRTRTMTLTRMGFPPRARADQAHLPAEDVHQLRQLIAVNGPQDPADERHPRVAGDAPGRPGVPLALVVHRPQLVDGEHPAELPDPLLRVERRPPRRL